MPDDFVIPTPPKDSKGVFLVYNQVVYPIVGEITSIGRDKHNDLIIDEENVSRLHAVIKMEEDDFILYDMDSSNGTFVNHAAVDRFVLQPGNLIYLADVAIVFAKEDEQTLETHFRDTAQLEQ